MPKGKSYPKEKLDDPYLDDLLAKQEQRQKAGERIVKATIPKPKPKPIEQKIKEKRAEVMRLRDERGKRGLPRVKGQPY